MDVSTCSISLFCECDGQRCASIPFRLQKDFAIDVLVGGILTIQSISYDVYIKKNEMVRANGVYGGVERCTKCFDVQTWQKGTTLKT